MSDFTIGVEEEYQLVDADTGDLQSRARLVLAADWTGEVRKEIQESTVEIGTRVCASAAEVEEELKRLRFQTAAAAASEGLNILAAGLHPTSRWQGHVRTAGARYERMGEEYGRLTEDEHNFGMHIHVAVPARLDAVRIMNAVRHYIPHLLALSCSSPFHEGADTLYASFRMILWRRWPNSGVPPHFPSRAEYGRHLDLLLRSGAIGDARNLYWSIRPHSEYPTLEFRVTDVCLRVEDAAAISALARALVAGAAAGMVAENPWPAVSTDLAHTILAANEWRAARYGLDAAIVDPSAHGASARLRDDIARLLERLAPVAADLGDAELLERIGGILDRGNGADRMRSVFAEHGRFGPLLTWLHEETMHGTGVDRRRDPRPATV